MNVRKKLIRTLLSAALAVAMTTGLALASIGTGVVTAGSLRLREQPNTNCRTLAFVSKHATVTLLEQVSDGWYKVRWNGMEGYMSADWLNVTLTPAEEAEPAEEPAVQPAEKTATLRGKVNTSVLNVRSGPGTSYGKIGTLRLGASLTVTDRSVSGWYHISTDTLTGWVSADYVTLTEDTGTDTPSAQPQRGVVTTGSLNVRSGPGTSYGKVSSLKRGAVVTVESSTDGWYKISSPAGWVSADYISLLDDTVTDRSVGEAAAAMAVSLLGCRYVYGAAGPTTFDCSGLFYYIFGQLGHPISRGSSAQYRYDGVFVSADELQPGDLVFFFDPKFDASGGTLPTTHVGMYVGNNRFINASTVSNTVRYDTLFGSYYENYIVGFKRIG